VLPFLERYNVNLLAHYEFSEALEVFVEAKANRVNALGNNAGPSFIQGQVTAFDFRERPRLDNPFLNPADRTTLANLILASGFEPRLVSRVALTQATRDQIAAGTFRFDLARTLLDVGIRDEEFQRDTFRVVAGLRGTFNGDWGYELSANYGKFEQETTTSGFIDRQRFVLAMDAGRNPATGQIQCRSQFDPAAAIPIQRTDAVSLAIAAQNAARLSADIAACRPYNPFGAADNREAINYFSRTFTAEAGLDQLIFSGFVSGDSSQLFELPGGPISFALGAEYRREEAFYTQDPFVTQGFTNGVSIPPFEPEPFQVKEAFAEVRVPILRDLPFFEELTLSAAGRVADYEGSVGVVYSYNAGVDYAPVRDVRFRANYSRAVRAPNVSETAFPLVPNFAPGFTDPCNTNLIVNNPNRTKNCTADVGAANLPNLQPITFSLPIVSGSNPNLIEETSDSYTVGAVIQPRFIPGFSLSVDYYKITVNDIIASVGAQGIVNSCYDLPDLNNIFCQQFTRFKGPGTGPNGELPGALLGNSLINAPLNFARREREGIDVNLAYRTNISEDVRFDTNFIYTHNITISNFQSATNPQFANFIIGELGDPIDEFRWDVDLTYREFTFGYRLRFIGAQTIGAFEDINPSNGASPANLDVFAAERYPVITYSDLRFEWNIDGNGGITDDFRFYVGVDNVLNQQAPFGLTSTGTSAIYEFRGRNYYAGIRARF
jgi:outer membrane receptor protein involved in Fe transport